MHRNAFAVLVGAQLAAAGLYPGITPDNHTCILSTSSLIIYYLSPIE